MRLLLLLALPASITAMRVSSWYLPGPDVTQHDIEDDIDWDAYTHIHWGVPTVGEDGVAQCDYDNPQHRMIRAVSRRHGTKLLWGLGVPDPLLHDILWGTNGTQGEKNYLASIGAAMDACDVDGIEVDYEFQDSPHGRLGIVTPEGSTRYTHFLAAIKRSLGPDKTVAADISIWGVGHGEYLLGVLPWINATMLNRGDFDYVNTMSYHWSRFNSLWAWEKDVFFLDLWGIDRSRVNLGLPYFSSRFLEHGRTEPTWRALSPHCPHAPPRETVCNGTVYVGKDMNLRLGEMAAKGGFGGVFPWAASYDTRPADDNSLVTWLMKGLNTA